MYSTSERGGSIFLHNGYRYRVDRKHVSSTSWRCTERGCKGRLVTSGDSTSVRTEHLHAPDPARNEAYVVKAKIRESARATEERPRAIITAAARNITCEAAVHLPSYNASRRAIQRARDKDCRQRCDVKCVADIVLEDKHKYTNNGEVFLLWDSGAEPGRIFIFGTHANLTILQDFKHWAVDGTFKVAPQYFVQLYTIHVLIDGKALPMVYAFTTNKQESTYRRILEKLLQLKPTLNPDSVVSDYESASINAMTSVFPGVSVVGCSFHLSQCLWRKIQTLRLTEAYRCNVNIRVKCKMLLALSYIPERDVQFAFEIITEKFPEELRSIVEYWESTYVGRRLLGLPPRFPISIWNMFSRLQDHLPRTNNSLEAWHNSFQKSVDCHSPSIFKLINKLQVEQQHVMNNVTRYRAGFRVKECQHSKYALRARRLRTLATEYSFAQVEDYLEAVALNLSI